MKKVGERLQNPGWSSLLRSRGGTGCSSPTLPSGAAASSAPPRWRIFIKRLTQMSWPRFVYILGNWRGAQSLDMLSDIAICAPEGRMAPRKVGLRTDGV